MGKGKHTITAGLLLVEKKDLVRSNYLNSMGGKARLGILGIGTRNK